MYLLHPVCDTFTQTYIWHSVMSYDVCTCTPLQKDKYIYGGPKKKYPVCENRQNHTSSVCLFLQNLRQLVIISK